MRGILVIFYLTIFSINSIGQNPDLYKFTPPIIISDSIDYDSILNKIDITANDSSKINDFSDWVDRWDIMPSFPGGEKALYKFLSDNISYPDSSIKAGIQGKVYTVFTVDTNGRLTDIRIVKGLSNDIDKEVIRIFSIMPNWIPYTTAYSNHKHKVQMILPIQFELTNDKSESHIKKKNKNKKDIKTDN
jgi:TonB family protein